MDTCKIGVVDVLFVGVCINMLIVVNHHLVSILGQVHGRLMKSVLVPYCIVDITGFFFSFFGQTCI